MKSEANSPTFRVLKPRHIAARLAILISLAVILFTNFSKAQSSLQVAAWGLNGYGQAWVPQDLTNMRQVASGGDFTLALQNNGRVKVWGGSAAWQTNLPPSLTNISAIAACATHCLALRSNGTVVGWGNPNLQFVSSASQITNPPVSTAKAIAAGYNHTLILQSNGTVVQYGEWDSGTAGFSPPAGLDGVISIGTADSYSVALKSNGTVVSWSSSPLIGVDVPSGLSEVKAIANGYGHILALKSNSTVVAWGFNRQGQTNIPTGLTNVVAVAAGSYHSMALREDGTLVIWGSDQFGELQVPAGLTNIASIQGGQTLSFALVSNTAPAISKQPKGRSMLPGKSVLLGVTATGTSPLAYRWQLNGTDVDGGTNSTLLLTNFSSSKAGEYQIIVTNTAGSTTSQVASVTVGSILGWGSNSGEQTEPPPGLTNPIAIAAYGSFTAPCIGLKPDGSVGVWGPWNADTPSDLTNAIQVAVGDSRLLAVRTDGTVVSWGSSRYGLTNVPPGVSNVISAAGDASVSLVLKQDGTVAAWGNSAETNVPPGLTNAVSVGCGARSGMSFAVRADGRVQCWGVTGSLTNPPASLTNAVSAAGAGSFTIALKSDGTVVNWGPGGGSPPAGLSNVVAISSGIINALALRNDGTLITWGNSSSGEGSVPNGLSNVVRIASGESWHLAVVGDGRPGFATFVSKRTIKAGGMLQLPAFAASSLPMSYQWFFNGQPLNDQTNATLLLQNTPVTSAGDYTVVVSNAVGVVTSAVTTVTITRDPLRFDTTPGALSVTNDALRLRLTGLAGAGPVVIRASTNASDWSPIYTNPPIVGTLDFTDSEFTNTTMRLYQAVEGP